ncbi:MAG TPA: heme-binding domain-containing protein [Ignavibacteriaceae bacterium]
MKKFLIALVVLFVGIQFIPVERTNPPVTSEVNAPADVKAILKKACYDCHSNETNWVWYTKVAPSSFLAVKDVNDGRKHLNFSEWNVNKESKYKEEIWDEIREEQMPPWQYKIIHSEAKLTPEEKNLLRNWATNK